MLLPHNKINWVSDKEKNPSLGNQMIESGEIRECRFPRFHRSNTPMPFFILFDTLFVQNLKTKKDHDMMIFHVYPSPLSSLLVPTTVIEQQQKGMGFQACTGFFWHTSNLRQWLISYFIFCS